VLAAERGVSRSAYARQLLSGEPGPAAAALVVDKPKPQVVAPTAARTPTAVSPQRDGCARCGCAVTRDAIRWGTCEDCGHPRLDH
jgi:hypothetical protein